MKKIYVLFKILILILIFQNIFSQTNSKIDSLKNLYKNAKKDSTRCRLILAIAKQQEKCSIDSAILWYMKAKGISEKNKEKDEVFHYYSAKVQESIGRIEYENNNINISLQYIKKAIKIYDSLLISSKDITIQKKCKNGIAVNNICKGNIQKDQSDYAQALESYLVALKIYNELGEKLGISSSYNNIGLVYKNQGAFDKAMEFYLKALKIFEEIKNKTGILKSYNNIGNIHKFQGNYDKALEYYKKSLKLSEEIGSKGGIINSYTNIGIIYRLENNFEKAIEYYNKAKEIAEETGDKMSISNTYLNLGNVFASKGNYGEAIEFYKKSLKISYELGEKSGIVSVNINLATIYIMITDSTPGPKNQEYLKLAVEHGLKAYNLSMEIQAIPLENDAAEVLIRAYRKQGNFKKAMEFADVFITTQDSMFAQEKTKSLAEAEAKFNTEKKQKEIELLNKDKALQKIEIEKQTTQKYAFIFGFALMLVLAFVIFRSYRQKRKDNIQLKEQKHEIEEKNEELNQQNEEIRTQRDEIESQRDEIIAQRDTVTRQKDHIEKIHLEVSQSINYATRIQRAILPESEILEKYILEFFVLYRPKDKVSGDFYWWAKVENYLIVTIADCTGHGVPGAFMSMLGTSFLREIVVKEYMTNPSIILKRLRKEIIQALKQRGESGEQKDGMDMALISINIETLQIQYAGANNPLYLIRNGELKEYKADKMPVAIYENMQAYINQEFTLTKGDCLYMMSDGYQDQFGGPKLKKFLAKNLKNLLIANCQLPMAEQKKILETTVTNWIGNEEQIDDITVLGIKI